MNDQTDEIIFEWELPGDHPNFSGHDDLPTAYRVKRSDTAACGIIIYAKYHDEWVTNPWNTRTLVRHLLTRLMPGVFCDNLAREMEAVRGLKSCPFCGSNEIYGPEEYDKHGTKHHAVICGTCLAAIFRNLKEDVERAWNTRRPDTSCTNTTVD